MTGPQQKVEATESSGHAPQQCMSVCKSQGIHLWPYGTTAGDDMDSVTTFHPVRVRPKGREARRV